MAIQTMKQYRRSPFAAFSRWWRDWMTRSSASAELRCCGEDELKRMARDAGMSVAELHKLASRSPHSADLLLRRLAELDLDRNEVARTEPRTFQDLQRVCTLCDARRKCARDFANHSTENWQSYCPNAATLLALNAQPWAARREW
jgi:hypothetical protein